jgi:hypothetical protein
MKLAESASAARGAMKMMRVVGVCPEFRALAALLLLPLGQAVAGGWEDGIVLDEGSGVAMPHDGGIDGQVAPDQFAEAPVETVDPGSEHPITTLDDATGPQGLVNEWNHPTTTGPCEPQYQAGMVQPCHVAHGAAQWAFRADALVLWRDAPASRPLFSTVVPGTDELGPTALNANDLNSDVLAAPRLSLLRTACDGHTFETTYLYAGNFYSERSLAFVPDGYATSPPGIYGNTWGPPDTSLDSASATLTGQLQSLEFNTRHSIWGGMSQFLMGARWLQWNETLQMTDSFFYAEPDRLAGKDFYETRCFNNLWGGQIGLDTLLLGQARQKRIEGVVKAGAYYNAAGQASSVRYVLGDDDVTAQARAGGPPACSFVGEVGLTAVLPICCNWDFRCGYFGLWLTNLAQPVRQLSGQDITPFSSKGSLDTAGSAIIQGLSLGLEGRW